MATSTVPRSAGFVFEIAGAALTEQLGRIDSLDSKAGILLAGDGILAGFVFGHQAFVASAPASVAIVAGFFLLVSLACTVIAFANRDYELAPTPEEAAPSRAHRKVGSSGTSSGTCWKPSRPTGGRSRGRPAG